MARAIPIINQLAMRKGDSNMKRATSLIMALAVSAMPLLAVAADKPDKSESGAAAGASGKAWPSFRKADADNNGAVSMEEARGVSGLGDSFATYDKNGDGQLSRSEYESAKKAQKSSKKSGGAGSSGAGSSGAGSPGSGAGATGGSGTGGADIGGAGGAGSGSR
jgi:hypothetical protein